MRWFGKKWDGEICSLLLQVSNPGGRCCFCQEKIKKKARGFAFEGGAACHKKCLSRSIKGKVWVDHKWTSKMATLWTRVWTCSRCGVSASGDPDTKEGREKNLQNGLKKDCTAQLVDEVSRS